MESKFFSRLGEQSISPLLLFVVVSILLMACQKTETVNIDNSSVAEAKSWFSVNVLAGESRMLAKPFSELPATAPARVHARMNKLSKKLDWSKAITGSADKLEYVLVPLQKDNLQLKNNYFIKRVFVFYEYNNAPMQMQVVELLSKGQAAADPAQLAATLFERKVAAKRLPSQIQDIQAFFYDKQYNTLDAYTIKDNQWQVLQASCLNKVNNNQLATESENSSCQQWNVYLVYYDEEGNEVDRELLFSYWKGNCNSGGDYPYEEQPEESGGGEEEGNEAFRTLTWHVYNTSGEPLSTSGDGRGVNSMENVRGKRSSSYPGGGYFKSATHHYSACNSCNDDSGNNTYVENSANVSYTTDQVSSSIAGGYYDRGSAKSIAGAKSWTFNQVF